MDLERDMDSLFHYTTAAGLQGILTGYSLWASDLRFLNDASEARYAYDVFVEGLSGMTNPAIRPDHPVHDRPDEFGAEFAGYKDSVMAELNSPEFPIYVCCFCESGDLLSQWRAYGSDHGYAVEIKTDGLREIVAALPTYAPAANLVQVQYGRKAASTVLLEAMQDVAQDTNLGHVGVHAHYMALRLTAMLARVKHPGFSEEQEWRLVAGFEYEEADLVRFRSTPMAIVPYIEVPLVKEMIRSIRIGPGRHVDVREAGVQRLLRHVGCDVPIVRSDVPLRT